MEISQQLQPQNEDNTVRTRQPGKRTEDGQNIARKIGQETGEPC